MAPVVEIITFVATEAYRKDPSVTNPALELLQSVPGFIEGWHGLQIQDPSVGYFVLYWETVEHYLRYMADEVEFGKLNKALQPICVSRSLIHVRHQDITSALEAPTTEFVLWTLHEGADRDAYRATAQRLVDAVSSELPGEFFGGGFGEVVEDERKFSVVFGWHSVERFNAAVYGSPKTVGIVEELRKLAEPDLKHANLQRYKKN